MAAENVPAAFMQSQRGRDATLERPLAPGFDLQGVLKEESRDNIKGAFQKTEGRKNSAGELPGLANPQTLSNRMEKPGITIDDIKSGGLARISL